jgi:predicted GNAT family N-acyltransferase
MILVKLDDHFIGELRPVEVIFKRGDADFGWLMFIDLGKFEVYALYTRVTTIDAELMTIEIRFADEPADKQSVFRLRYEIYVEEMDRYRSISDEGNRVMIEDVDALSRFLIAEEDGQIVGAMRWTWGGDHPFTERHIEQYFLQPFLDHMPAEQLIVGERFMVTKELRGSNLLFQMLCRYLEFCNDHRIQLVFGDCEPHLLNLYVGLGFRPYSDKNINSTETGYLIPLILVPEDVDYMNGIGSPLAGYLKDFGGDKRIPTSLEEQLKRSAVKCARLVPSKDYWGEIHDALFLAGQKRPTLFDGLPDKSVKLFLEKSNVIDCKVGDRVLKKGNVAQNMFVVLSGVLEVRDGNDVVAYLSPGDILGEVAFLLHTPRTADVYAVTTNTRLLSLSESTVRERIDDDPEIAATVLLNLSKMLCQKLVA